MEVPLLLLDKTWTSNPVTEFQDPIDCEIFDQVRCTNQDVTLMEFNYTLYFSYSMPNDTLHCFYTQQAKTDLRLVCCTGTII